MRFSTLPAEILYCIADQIEYTWEINTLCLVNRHFYQIFNPYLSRFNKQYSQGSVLDWAVRKGSETLAHKLLSDLVSTDRLDPQTWTSVARSACDHGQVHVFRLLLEAGQSLFIPSEMFKKLNWLFWESLSTGNEPNEPIIRLLLQHGASFDGHPAMQLFPFYYLFSHPGVVKAVIEYTPLDSGVSSVPLADLLHGAFMTPNSCTPEIIDCFISRGVDLSTIPVDTGVGTTLYHAIHQLRPRALRYLLQLGLGLKIRESGASLAPLRVALHRHQPDNALVLLEWVDVNKIMTERKEVDWLLCIAAALGLASILQQLLQTGCSPDLAMPEQALGGPGLPAIAWAARFQQSDMVEVLIEHGAKPYYQALIYALQTGNVPIAEMLLKAGADPNCRAQLVHLPALCVAAPNETLFRLLLAHGAHMPEQGWYPSVGRYAISRGGIPQVQMLLDRGMSLDGHSSSVFVDAIRVGATMLEFIESHVYRFDRHERGAFDESPFIDAIESNDVPTFTWLVNNGFIEVLSDDELCKMLFTLFERFDSNEATQALDFLLSRGVNINASEAGVGHRVLWGVLAYGLPEWAPKLLLDRGADPSLWPGETPVGVAGCLWTKRNLEFMLEQMRPKWSRRDMGLLLQVLKETAKHHNTWQRLRIVERFECKHGFGFYMPD
ncbi:hypothetical protein ASPSYDRAFT_35996 [Aspergillus sydowii CBS 593.65]|uniref:Uncharacterized protein n=1 Tax=Aspergillus sydowii CBS 593.65 TaxID=1036612 RepID=A0A1L9T2S3_9EURO|nr:uncharacterized protein ASPSYDRAFT_35996 [Aspergillus sydowii CBS 593.65]OJJ53754.1 hypothetical protein ASPSYDRAFT_35996 [Aspergillus sydowii CBS 593.65]